MATVLITPPYNDDERRQAMYQGDLEVGAPTERTRAFCEFARKMIEEAFQPFDPEVAQDDMAVEDFAATLAELKPRFIHDPRSKEFIREILAERGSDLDRTYFDVPRLRSSTSGGYLTTGIAYAWHPHRDTWYSAPMQQINHWMPVYPIEAANALAFHDQYFATEVPNSSACYNYYEWNSKHRATASKNIKTDSRPLPGATGDLDISRPLVLVPDVGGVITFSGQHLHSSVPNWTGRTRYSIDFRTVDIDDIVNGRSAPNVDVECTGSAIRDFIRASDFAPLPQNIVDLFVDGTEDRGALVFSGAPA